MKSSAQRPLWILNNNLHISFGFYFLSHYLTGGFTNRQLLVIILLAAVSIQIIALFELRGFHGFVYGDSVTLRYTALPVCVRMLGLRGKSAA